MSAKGLFIHEEAYRGEVMKKMVSTHLTVCGVGALGSNLVDNLARQGFKRFRVIDMDRVESHNINSQVYSSNHVGALKVAALRTIVYQAVKVEIEPKSEELTEKNVKKLLRDTDLVVDCFDNSASRQILTDYCRDNTIACLHVGLAENYGEAVWNENYVVPQAETGTAATCDL